MNDGARIGYSELVAICHVDDPRDYFDGYRLELDGLYVVPPNADAMITPIDHAVLSWHPTGDHSKPALSLPCTLMQLRTFVAEAGLLGCIVEEAVDEMLGERAAARLAETPIDSGSAGDAQKVGADGTAKAKPGRKPGTQRESLGKILAALEAWGAKSGNPFDRNMMPGQVGTGADDDGGFHWFCVQLFPREFLKGPRSFENYRARLCTFPPYAKPSDYYCKALPHIAQSLGVSGKTAK